MTIRTDIIKAIHQKLANLADGHVYVSRAAPFDSDIDKAIVIRKHYDKLVEKAVHHRQFLVSIDVFVRSSDDTPADEISDEIMELVSKTMAEFTANGGAHKMHPRCVACQEVEHRWEISDTPDDVAIQNAIFAISYRAEY